MYDEYSNLKTHSLPLFSTQSSIVYDSNNQLPTSGIDPSGISIGFVHDSRGNMIRGFSSDTEYGYDNADQLVAILGGSAQNIALYFYDEFGNRIYSKRNDKDGEEIITIYSSSGLLLQ